MKRIHQRTLHFFGVEYPPEENEGDFMATLFFFPAFEQFLQESSLGLIKVQVTCGSHDM
jgi:hypothetical protein